MPESTKTAVALFGGSFDPPHLGHLAAASAAADACSLSRLVVLPCAQSPHKPEAPGASAEQRLAMLKLLFHSTPNCTISSLELDSPPPSYSWKTAEHFHQHLAPGESLHWILGADQWEQLHRWARFQHLCSLVRFIVLARPGAAVVSRPEADHVAVPLEHPASSSALRQMLQARQPVPDSWLPAPLREYIEREGLYRL